MPKPRTRRAASQRVGRMVGGTVANAIHCATFVSGDLHITFGSTPQDSKKIVEKLLALRARGGVLLPADERGSLGIERGDESLTFAPGAAKFLEKRRSLHSHLLALTLHQDYRAWATKFVPLAGRMDIRRTVEGMDVRIGYSEFHIPTGGEGQATYQPLEDITQAVNKHSAFVILGEPGAGKTTTLQKIAYDAAASLLDGQPGCIPLFVRLSRQKSRDPFDFLESEWHQRIGTSFADALAHGQCLLLVDGLNELPRDDRDERLKDWRLFTEECASANQIIFTGRERDYAGQLELPRVRVDPLDPARIADYLKRNRAEGLAPQLADRQSRLLDLARNPFNLSLLVYAYQSNQREMSNRGRLFEWFVDNLFWREERLAHKGWLPRDAQMAVLARLAFAMQERGESTTLDFKIARAIVPSSVEVNGDEIAVKPADLFRFACAATILDPSTEPDVRFYHHLLQEHFAALDLLRRFDEGEDLSRLWKSKRRVDEMPPANVGEWDPLPEPPATGWEVTTILACGLARDPGRFIEAIRPHNPNLAGRCVDESGIPQSPISNLKSQVRADLRNELYNPAFHLRARLQAGYTLGRLGDPRFEPQIINGVKVIVPQMVATPVPAGKYLIGSGDNDEQAFGNEKPQGSVDLPAFAIGKWPVTNAEFACFIDAGGYKDEQWWKTEAAKRWLHGETVSSEKPESVWALWNFTHARKDWKEQLQTSGLLSPEQLQAAEAISGMSEEDYHKFVTGQFSEKSRERPEWWDNSDYNNPSQPVVGLTWFEANAYCEWLSTVTSRPFRLPTEAEWEAAARGLPSPFQGDMSPEARRSGEGPGVRVFPWGNDWDTSKANTIEGRVLKPSPVGAYAAAESNGPFGAEDQAGNVWNWTSTLYKDYPYNAEDGREDPNAEGERVVRGGSWNIDHWNARCAYRNRDVPVNFGSVIGFRLLSPVSISGF